MLLTVRVFGTGEVTTITVIPPILMEVNFLRKEFAHLEQILSLKSRPFFAHRNKQEVTKIVPVCENDRKKSLSYTHFFKCSVKW